MDFVDPWAKEKDELELEIEKWMYPPSFQVTANSQQATTPSSVTVYFTTSNEDKFSISLHLQLPNNLPSSTQSESRTLRLLFKGTCQYFALLIPFSGKIRYTDHE